LERWTFAGRSLFTGFRLRETPRPHKDITFAAISAGAKQETISPDAGKPTGPVLDADPATG